MLKLRAQLVTVEAFVSNHLQPATGWQQVKDMVAFIGLAFDKLQIHWQAASVSNGHDLGVSASAGLAHGLCGGAACRICGTLMHHHMGAINQTDFAAGFAGQPGKQLAPNAVTGKAPAPSIDGAPGAEAIWQVTPGSRIAQAIKQGVQNDVQRRWRPAARIQGIIF